MRKPILKGRIKTRKTFLGDKIISLYHLLKWGIAKLKLEKKCFFFWFALV
jgi:hypothetical protein